MMTQGFYTKPLLSLLIIVGALSFAANVNISAQTASRPSAFCHSTDGTFTVCPDGRQEWSDVPFEFFPDSNSYLYADQADLDPTLVSPSSPVDTFMLMYDECGRTMPLGPNEYFLVSFKTVEVENGAEKLEHYVIHIFTDGTIIFIENGVAQQNEEKIRAAEIAGQRGRVGFGRSPNCPFDHVIAEFEIKLSATGIVLDGGYSPDPLFWSGITPEEPELPECPNRGQTLPVNLHRVVAPVQSPFKSYQIIYDDLPLDFTVTDGSAAGSPCRVVSNRGGLPVLLDLGRELLPPGPFQFASSTATSTLDFFPEFDASTLERCDFAIINNNCFLNSLPSDSGPVVRWSTDGFQKSVFGIDFANTGPLTFFVNLDDFGGSFSSFGALLQQTEQFIHETAIDNLSGIDRLALIQDPPVDLLVADQDGRRTGVLPDGTIVNEIPRSGFFRFDELTAVILVEPEEGFLNVQAIGAPGDEFLLSMSVADFLGNVEVPRVTEQIVTGTIDPAGNFYNFEVMPRFTRILFGTDASGGNLLTIDPNIGAGTVVGFMDAGAVPALAIDPTTGIMYAGRGAGIPNLYRVNAGTGAASLVGDTGLGLAAFGGMDFGSNGTLYAAVNIAGDGGTGSDHLAVLGKTTGAATVIGPFGTCTGVTIPSSGGGSCTIEGIEAIAFDRAGTLWGALSARGAAGTPGLYSIDPTTGAAIFAAPIRDASGAPPSGGVVSLQFGCDGTLFGGTARAIPPATDGGRLITIDTATGRFTPVGAVSATGGESLAALALQCPVSRPMPEAIDEDGVSDELDNCPLVSNSDQKDSNLNGIGDACETPDLQHSTAAFLQAVVDGRTSVEPTPLLIEEEPTLTEQLVRIVDFRVQTGLTTSATQLTQNLVDSLVEVGVISPSEADELESAVLQQVTLPVTIDIKPGDGLNCIQATNKGVTPAAILGKSVNVVTVAVGTVQIDDDSDPSTTGVAPVKSSFGDVEKDGKQDLVLQFRTPALKTAGLLHDGATLFITGALTDGRRIRGSDTIFLAGGPHCH